MKRVFGKRAVVQRCTLDTRRNVSDYLPEELAGVTDAKLAKAFNDADEARGKRVAEGIARQPEAKYPSAAASLCEGLDDMFAVRRLGVSDRPAACRAPTRSSRCSRSFGP